MSNRLLAVTAIGTDRPGIVAGVTGALYESGCNLEDVSSTILRGHFSMVLAVSSERSAEEVEDALAEVASRLDLVVTVRPMDPADAEIDPPTHMVSVYGSDRPGIVYRVTETLASAGANVTDLTSRVIGESDSPVYALMLEVSAPGEVDLTGSLDALRSELGVDISVHPIDADVL